MWALLGAAPKGINHSLASVANGLTKSMSAATVGLVGVRQIDSGLQSQAKKTVTEFAFPNDSRTADAIGHCPEGSLGYKGPKTGDSYTDGVENTQL